MIHDIRMAGGSFKDVSNLHAGHEHAKIKETKNVYGVCANIRLLNTHLTKSTVRFQEHAYSRVIVHEQRTMQFKTLNNQVNKHGQT
jgi:hypothetical protein